MIYNKNMSEIKNTEREPRSCIYRLLVNRNSNPEICRAISLYIYIHFLNFGYGDHTQVSTYIHRKERTSRHSMAWVSAHKR